MAENERDVLRSTLPRPLTRVTFKVDQDCAVSCKENGMELLELPSRDLIGLRAGSVLLVRGLPICRVLQSKLIKFIEMKRIQQLWHAMAVRATFFRRSSTHVPLLLVVNIVSRPNSKLLLTRYCLFNRGIRLESTTSR
jgi:hypothetical protein